MPSIPELLSGHLGSGVPRPVVPERVYRSAGDIGRAGNVHARVLGKPIPSPVVLGQVAERFREAVKTMAEREQVPIYQFHHRERKDDVGEPNPAATRGQRRDRIFIGVVQEKAQAFQGNKINAQFEFTRDKTVYANHYYFYIDDANSAPLFVELCSYAPWGREAVLDRA